MRKRKVTPEAFYEAVKKMQEEKNLIQDHIHQGKDLGELKEKGINFIMPIKLEK